MNGHGHQNQMFPDIPRVNMVTKTVIAKDSLNDEFIPVEKVLKTLLGHG